MERLKSYKARLILFPRKSGQHKTLDSSKEEVSAVNKGEAKLAGAIQGVLPVKNVHPDEAVSEVSKNKMPKGEENAYRTLRMARSDARLVGVREKRAKAKAEEAESKKK